MTSSTRKILPAYGVELLKARELGQHPKNVWVYYGKNWKARPAERPCLCVDKSYKPGIYDWSIVAGVPVDVILDHDECAASLVAEIAHFAAPVVAYYSVRDKPHRVIASIYLWPFIDDPAFPLWSHDIEREYEARFYEYAQAKLDDCISETSKHGD